MWSRSSGAWFPGPGSLDSAEMGLRLPRKCSVWYGHAEGGARGDSESFHSQPGHRHETWGLRAGTEKSRGMQVQGGAPQSRFLRNVQQMAPMCKDREEAPGRGAGLERAWTGWGKNRAHAVPQGNPSEEGWKREEMELSLGYLRLFIHPFSKR